MKFALILFITFALLTSCEKYLEQKPSKNLVVPETLADLQTLLDNDYKMNLNCTVLGETSADNYYLTNAQWSGLSSINRMVYVWDTAIYTYGSLPNDWYNTFQDIYYANVVLDNIQNISRNSSNQQDWDNIKGSALVFRARSFLEAAWTWAAAYDENSTDLNGGIPLRLTSDFNIPSSRTSVKDTYKQIIQDLKDAIPLLPTTPTHVMRPSKPAALGLLARAYLSMRQYDSCFKYSDLYLQLDNQLLDFSSLNPAAGFPIQQFNIEVTFQDRMQFTYLDAAYIYAKVDSLLYTSYGSNDLRKLIFFKYNADQTVKFVGSYDGTLYLFNGIATDEMYLMRAECEARLGNTASAMNDLNILLEKRWVTDTFIPLTASTSDQALSFVLTERRKELLFRGLRWMDIKRLNKEGANITLVRNVNNQTYTLPPNDNRFAIPIPADIIDLTEMQQNPR